MRPATRNRIPASKSRPDEGIRAETVLNWPGKWSQWQDFGGLSSDLPSLLGSLGVRLRGAPKGENQIFTER